MTAKEKTPPVSGPMLPWLLIYNHISSGMSTGFTLVQTKKIQSGDSWMYPYPTLLEEPAVKEYPKHIHIVHLHHVSQRDSPSLRHHGLPPHTLTKNSLSDSSFRECLPNSLRCAEFSAWGRRWASSSPSCSGCWNWSCC